MKIKHMILKIREAERLCERTDGKQAVSGRGRLIAETAVYGLMAAIYTSLFFFGALYPKYGLPPQSIVYDETEETAEQKESDAEGAAETGKKTESTEGEDAAAEETVVYKSLILERIKEWF